MRNLFVAAILSGMMFSGGGCVAYQMRDELRITNAQLATMNGKLDKMAADLALTNQKLERSNQSLAVTESSMEPIRVSLRRIDDEMAGFREMLDKIDKYVPVNIKADTPEPAKQKSTEETTPQK
jgi:septal ring factor EnvC (AmiA/AmiB activator)